MFVFGPDSRNSSLNQFTFGFEKSNWNRLWSFEFRVPIVSRYQFVTPNFDVFSGKMGNVALLVKRKVYEDEFTAVAIGLGVELPTASDVLGSVNQTSFLVENNAVRLLPFLGMLSAPTDMFFYQAVLQLDVATNGNDIRFFSPFDDPGTLGRLRPQSLLYLDLAAGYWLFGNPNFRPDHVGGSVMAELHYTTAVQDSDVVTGSVSGNTLTFLNPDNRFDVLNLATGVHFEVGRTELRLATVFPLKSEPDRFFDFEVQASVHLRF